MKRGIRLPKRKADEECERKLVSIFRKNNKLFLEVNKVRKLKICVILSRM